jgi:hypothetical protein
MEVLVIHGTRAVVASSPATSLARRICRCGNRAANHQKPFLLVVPNRNWSLQYHFSTYKDRRKLGSHSGKCLKPQLAFSNIWNPNILYLIILKSYISKA